MAVGRISRWAKCQCGWRPAPTDPNPWVEPLRSCTTRSARHSSRYLTTSYLGRPGSLPASQQQRQRPLFWSTVRRAAVVLWAARRPTARKRTGLGTRNTMLEFGAVLFHTPVG